MIFTWRTREARIKMRRDRLREWRLFFAWYPVCIDTNTNKFCWLELVEYCYPEAVTGFIMKYRLRKGQVKYRYAQRINKHLSKVR